MPERIDARRDPRYDIHRPVRIIPRGGEAISGTMQNVSRGGMLVALPVELELGRTYQIEVTDSQGAFCLSGEALRLHLPPHTPDGAQQPAPFRVGFEFVGINPSSGDRLAQLLREAEA